MLITWVLAGMAPLLTGIAVHGQWLLVLGAFTTTVGAPAGIALTLHWVRTHHFVRFTDDD